MANENNTIEREDSAFSVKSLSQSGGGWGVWGTKTKEAQVLSFSIIFGGAVLVGQVFYVSIEIYYSATQELERQAAATCKADALRNRPSKLIKSKSK